MIGISSPNFSLLAFDEMLSSISEEFDLWEIVAELEHELSEIESKISYAIDSYDMIFQIHGPIADLNIGSPSERLRRASLKELFHIMDSCERLSIPLLTIHPGSAVAYGNDIKDRVHIETRRSIEAIDERLEDMHLRVALENMPPARWSIGCDAEELMALIRDTSLGICLDVGHAHLAGSLEGFLHNDIPIMNVHLHDNNGEFDDHLVLGDGEIDIRSVFAILGRFYDMNYIIEARSLEEGVSSKSILDEMIIQI